MYESSNLEQACTTRASDGSFTLLTPSSNHVCAGHKLESARLWLGLAGLTVMCVLMHRGWRVSPVSWKDETNLPSSFLALFWTLVSKRYF